jgi:hypothetical protein
MTDTIKDYDRDTDLYLLGRPNKDVAYGLMHSLIPCHDHKCIYVMEFKLDKSAEEALAQIETKDYLIPYFLDERKKVKVGISFSSETRTLDKWVIE